MAACTVIRDSSDSFLLGTNGVWRLPASKKYRSHFEIMASILDVARNNSGDRYSLMKHSSVNYAQLKKYLGFLIRIRFVEVEMRERRIRYCATERGLAFLKQYHILLEMLADANAPEAQGQLVYQSACTS
jgi:predicted transcriptional regulator